MTGKEFELLRLYRDADTRGREDALKLLRRHQSGTVDAIDPATGSDDLSAEERRIIGMYRIAAARGQGSYITEVCNSVIRVISKGEPGKIVKFEGRS